MTDAQNCGACGVACPVGATCKTGLCKSICQPNEVFCNGACTDVMSNPNNCGTCGVVCGPGQTCNGGGCGCPPPTVLCAGACTNTLADAANCGGCGVACGANQTCVNGACVSSCGAGLLLCGSSCVDPLTSLQHCGGCNQGCVPGKTCTGGACVPLCGAGETLCNGACASLGVDPAHCGSCGNACPPGLSCVAGACGCPADLVLCDGACVDPTSDPAHCGASGSCQGAGAGAACAMAEVCANGVCAASCSPGKTACNGVCVDLQIDNDHCGSCGNDCPGDSACFDGTCSVAGPLYLVSHGSGATYTVDRITGQLTQVPGLFFSGISDSLTYDRRNGYLDLASAGLVQMKDPVAGGLGFSVYWSAAVQQLAHDPQDDVFYGAGLQNNVQGLWRWSPPGANLGALPLPPEPIAALAMDSRHRALFALAGTGLYRYDLGAGAWTLVASTGFDWGPNGFAYQTSLAYDPSVDVLYVTHWTDGWPFPGLIAPSFRRMDPKTGASAVVSAPFPVGPIALAVQGDGAQCLPGGTACGPGVVFCDAYEICFYTGFQSPQCMPALSFPDYCPVCADVTCPAGQTCSVLNEDEVSCQ